MCKFRDPDVAGRIHCHVGSALKHASRIVPQQELFEQRTAAVELRNRSPPGDPNVSRRVRMETILSRKHRLTESAKPVSAAVEFDEVAMQIRSPNVPRRVNGHALGAVEGRGAVGTVIADGPNPLKVGPRRGSDAGQSHYHAYETGHRRTPRRKAAFHRCLLSYAVINCAATHQIDHFSSCQPRNSRIQNYARKGKRFLYFTGCRPDRGGFAG